MPTVPIDVAKLKEILYLAEGVITEVKNNGRLQYETKIRLYHKLNLIKKIVNDKLQLKMF